ncbi:MAG TPA: transglutaminase domain-containing protein, partial [bacterium]
MKSVCLIPLLPLLIFTLMASPEDAPATTGDVLRSFPAPGTCSTGLCWDGKNLWVADLKSDTLYALNPDNGAVVRTLAAPTFRPVGLAWDGEQLWCVCGEEEKIYRLRPEDGLVTRVIDSPATKTTGLAWDGKYLWMATKAENQIQQISPEDGTTIRFFLAPARSSQGLAYDGRYLWVADRVSNRIFMVAPERGEVIITLDAPGPYADGLAWDGKNLWNVDFQSDSIYCLAIGGGDPYRRKDMKTQRVEFTHELRNYGPGSVQTLDAYIAVPQDLPNQHLLREPVFSPLPTDILTDQWGQKVAHYQVKDVASGTIPRAAMMVEAQLWDTRWFIFPEKVGGLSEIPKEIRDEYLIDDEKFDMKHPVIQKAVNEAVGDERNPYWIMRRIFRYVNDHMEYQLSGGWNTAPAVLERGNGSCSEYTFVFLSVCRAAGLPARYAGSIAIRGDDASLDDVFHRWAEVYLPNYGWIPVDPSGGDSPSPEAQADYIGHLANRYLITTQGGGNSEYLTWTYNSDAKWTLQGKCRIFVETIGEWNPIRPAADTTNQAESVKGGKVCE